MLAYCSFGWICFVCFRLLCLALFLLSFVCFIVFSHDQTDPVQNVSLRNVYFRLCVLSVF